MRTRACRLLIFLMGLAPWASAALSQAQAANAPPVIAAASDLRFALEDIAAAFGRDRAEPVRLTFGSSGNFARQIREGAPYQLFLSADEDYVLDLARDGLLRDQGRLYAIGRIVLLVRRGSRLNADAALDDLEAALDDGRLQRFAIANPDHAPYGRRAVEALRKRGLWAGIASHLVYGENVSQAAQFALSADVEGGIVALSLARAPGLSGKAEYALIPGDWHRPMRQRMALTRSAGPVAEQFYLYLQQPPAQAILERYGFSAPDDGREGD